MKKDYILENVKDFDLAQTLECGQCFHFAKLDEEDYVLSAHGRALRVAQNGDSLTFFDTDRKEYETIWRKYFDLDRDYGAIKARLLEKDDKLKEAIEAGGGVRLLNQEFFETLISFIISQNKQIPHIKKIVAAISERFGNYVGEYDINGTIPDGEARERDNTKLRARIYTFPTIEQLADATEEDFKALKTGFRAPYIMDAIEKYRSGLLDEAALLKGNAEEANATLMTIKGVGSKVSNCVSLFSLGHRESFPVDVWIKRMMEHMYFNDQDTKKEVIEKFGKEHFGELGGYAQQYIFSYGAVSKREKK